MAKKRLDFETRKRIATRSLTVKGVLNRLHIDCEDKTAWAIADLEIQVRHINELQEDIKKFAKSYRVPSWKFYAFFAYVYGHFDGEQIHRLDLTSDSLPSFPGDFGKAPSLPFVPPGKEPILPS